MPTVEGLQFAYALYALPARPAAVRALALGAVARHDDGRRRLAAPRPQAGRALRMHAAEFGTSCSACRRRARAARGLRRPAPGRCGARRDRLDHVPARAARARDARRAGARLVTRSPVIAGTTDLAAASAALSSRLPEPLGAAGAPRLQLPLVLDSRRRGALRLGRPVPLGDVRRQPGPPAPGGAHRRLEGAADGRRAPRRRAYALEERVFAEASRGAHRRRHRRPRGRSRSSAPSTASTPRCPIYSGGLGVLAGDILKEASDRGAAAGRGRPHVPPRLLPPAHRRLGLAARVLGRHRSGPRARRRWSPATDGEPAHGDRPDRRARRGGAGLARRRRPRAAATCSTPTGPRTAAPTAGSPRASTWATARRAPGAVRAARRRRRARAARAGHRARRGAPERGPRGARARSRSRAAGMAAAAPSRTPSRPSRRRTVFTTHTPVPAGNDTYRAEEIAGRFSRASPGGWASDSGARPRPRPHAARATRPSRSA